MAVLFGYRLKGVRKSCHVLILNRREAVPLPDVICRLFLEFRIVLPRYHLIRVHLIAYVLQIYSGLCERGYDMLRVTELIRGMEVQ